MRVRSRPKVTSRLDEARVLRGRPLGGVSRMISCWQYGLRPEVTSRRDEARVLRERTMGGVSSLDNRGWCE
jgi:hypothetical protein